MTDDDDSDDGQPRSTPSVAAVDLVVRVDHPGWHALAGDAETVAARAAAAVLELFEPEAVELSVVLSDDATVRALNREHRGKDYATNVLSFPPGFLPPAGPRPLGDVILALGVVGREAAEQGKAASDHLAHLVVHGVLHLCGHDHDSADAAEEMEQLEREVLAGLGIADPYADSDPEAGPGAAPADGSGPDGARAA